MLLYDFVSICIKKKKRLKLKFQRFQRERTKFNGSQLTDERGKNSSKEGFEKSFSFHHVHL